MGPNVANMWLLLSWPHVEGVQTEGFNMIFMSRKEKKQKEEHPKT